MAVRLLVTFLAWKFWRIARTDLTLNISISSDCCRLVVHFSSFDNRCGFCAKANPALDELANEFAGKVTFRRVVTMPWNNISPEMTTLKVLALSAVFLFQDGKLVYKYMGVSPKGYALLRAKMAE